MTIDENIRDDRVIVALTGRLDTTTAPQVEPRLLSLATQTHMNLVLDLSGLDYISSAGLRVVLLVAKRAKTAEGQFALCGMNEQIRAIFEVSGFLTILRVLEQCADALPGAGPA